MVHRITGGRKGESLLGISLYIIYLHCWFYAGVCNRLTQKSVFKEVRDCGGEKGPSWHAKGKADGEESRDYRANGPLECTSEEKGAGAEAGSGSRRNTDVFSMCAFEGATRVRNPSGLLQGEVGVKTPLWKHREAEGRIALLFNFSLLQW